MSEIIKVNQEETLAITREHYEVMTAFVKEQMKENVDFGVIPGTNSKPTLLKPGAEKLCRLLSLNPTFSLISSIIDFDKPVFYYHYQCSLYHKNQLVGQGDGSCNSKERKYRYRKAELTCPICGQPTVIKGKEQYGGGYVCYKKKGGCGAKFKDNDAEITNQDVGLIENPDIFDQVNTIQKMAQKRSLIAAVLCSVGASQFFTQDLEDMDFAVRPCSLAGSQGTRTKTEQPKQTRKVKNITLKSRSINNEISSDSKAKTKEEWYQMGIIDASNGEEAKYPNVQPYLDGFYEETKQRQLRKLEKDMEF
ncbi:hypothetical protein [Crocosphaera sp.]|uniref:hypothetical protein n=1 Tax=Crocosphaera sp. TaxID=2729996 RepID=UPI00262FED0D|nr:hypothetical protein [Crocosphaera sp.]MDJ0581693.1 hypothetical protein [Crocosphaera sp.]